jgi:nitrate reductase gamma subunit
MDVVSATRLVAIVGLALGVLGIAIRLRDIMYRPFKKDLSRARGSVWRGTLYAFTLGMAPWEKESTRRHWVSYFRGIFFHVGVFVAFGVLFASPWLHLIPLPIIWLALLVTAVGAVAGFAGVIMRLADENERVLSLPDDYFAVFLVSLFVALAFLVLLLPAALPGFYVVTAVMSVYIPFSKIRHCVYFFYSKFFFGLSFGHRGVIGQPGSEYID